MRSIRGVLLGVGCTAFLAPAGAAGIYTCIDANGRRLTADRPMIECLDREQRELNSSGTLRRKIPPSFTAAEREAIEAKARKDEEERNRATEERLRIRALLIRYPAPAVLERERLTALATVNELMETATLRTAELVTERRKLDEEAGFYRSEPARMPASLKRLIEQNEQDRATQERYIVEQSGQKQRINARFDDMLRQLQPLWAQP